MKIMTTWFRLFLTVALIFSITCSKDSPTEPKVETVVETTRHVIVFGLDGVRSDGLQAASTPSIDALIENGAVSYTAFAGGFRDTPSQQATSSGPGWSSILTGVWVDKHNVTNNSFDGSNYANYPHFFKRIRQAMPEAFLSSIVHWNPINQYILSDEDHKTNGSDQLVALQTLLLLEKNDPTVVFLHFDDVDGAGHSNGFTPANSDYLAAITEVDRHVGSVVRGVEKRANFQNEEWLFIVTADHGGFGGSHGGQSDGERTIFIVVSGPGTLSGELGESPGMVAVPPTVLTFLNIPIDPAWGWESAAFGLQ